MGGEARGDARFGFPKLRIHGPELPAVGAAALRAQGLAHTHSAPSYCPGRNEPTTIYLFLSAWFDQN